MGNFGIALSNDSNQNGIKEPYNVLLIGNNPMTLGNIYKNLLVLKGRKLKIDFSFDWRKSLLKALRFQPHMIFIDDSISKKFIHKFIDRISRNRKTQNIPITLLKSSNYDEIVTSGVQDYLLKENITPERLYHTIRNASSFNRTARLLKIASLKQKRRLKNWWNSIAG